MIPYVTIPDLPILGPIGVHAFGVMVAAGVLAAIWLAKKRSAARGQTPDDVDSLSTWLLIGGFVGAHLVDRLFYFPGETWSHPITLLEIWNGLASFGAGLGGAVGTILWLRKHHKPFLPMADLVASVLPLAWMLGRVGCAVVHDHPGIAAGAHNPFAVAFPDGPRYDLGLLEMFFWAALAIAFSIAWKKPRPVGTWLAWLAVTYAPVRFGLDFLRIEDSRYAGLTPAQWLCAGLFVAGLWVAMHLRRSPAQPATSGAA